MSTTTYVTQHRSTSLKEKNVRFKLALQIQTQESPKVSTNAPSAHVAVNELNGNISIPSPVDQLRIHTEHEEKNKDIVVDVPFKINRRPRSDSSDEEDSDTDTNHTDTNHTESNHTITNSNDVDSNPMDNLFVSQTRGQDSFNYSLSLSEFDGDEQTKPHAVGLNEDDHDDDGQSGPEPVNRRRGTLTRQRGKLDLLTVTIFDEVEDRDHDEYHPECPDIGNHSDGDGNEGDWYQRASSLYGSFTQNDGALHNNFPAMTQDDEPTFSIYGAMVRHQTVHGLKV